MALSHPLPASCNVFSALAAVLDPRSAPRLVLLPVGAVLARGRRTVTSWIRAAGSSDDYRPCYTTVAAAGKKADLVAARLARQVVRPLVADHPRLVLALDDTPTPRSGPHVRGAGIHHHPTPGPTGSAFLYGHPWVVLAALVPHPLWGVAALPLLARLYVRRTDLSGIERPHRPDFRTELELAVELMRWAKMWLGKAERALWVVTDGAYAKAPFLTAMSGLGVTVVSRLRKDAALRDVPPPKRPGQRGRPRVYGENAIRLACRAGQRRGWTTGTFDLYGEPVTKRYKTFRATWRPAGGVIRVVLADEPRGWRAYFCTDPAARVADILGLVADRFSLEIAFREVKEIVGAGQQQTRFHGANVGAFHVCLGTFTATEGWAWHRDGERLTAHREQSPWDDRARRPSHADKRRAWRREILGEEIRTALRTGADEPEIHALTERLLDLAA